MIDLRNIMAKENEKMMVKSKSAVVGIVVATALVIGYILYAIGDSSPAADDMKGWAKLILVFIAISVAAQIVTQIIVQIAFSASVAAKENCDDKELIGRTVRSELAEDEMDRRITHKASHVGYGIAGAGVVLGLTAAAFFDISVALFLNILLMVFFISMTVGAAVTVYMYEKGNRGWDC